MKRLVQHTNMYGGVDTSTPTHLVHPSKWFRAHDIRFKNGCRQVPRKYVAGDVKGGSPDRIVLLAGLAQQNKRSKIIALSDKSVYRLGTLGTNCGTVLKWENNQFRFVSDDNYRRWDSFVYNNNLYFSNELNPVRYTDGTLVKSLGEHTPCGRYIENFFDHLFVAYPKYKGGVYPTRVMWSDLWDFGKYDPEKGNEADFVDLEEFCLADVPIRAITGMRKLGDRLVVYMSTAIIGFQYTGLPKIVNWKPIATEMGNGLPYGLVSFRDTHFFYNVLDHNFYMFDGQSMTPIGDEIQSYWLDNVDLTDTDAIQKVWAYVDRTNNEVIWCFKSRSSVGGATDKAVCYNYRSKLWYHRNVEDIHSFLWGALRTKGCDEITAGADTIVTEAHLTDDGGVFPPIFGSSNTKLLAEDSGVIDIDDCIWSGDPYLETPDYIYEDFGAVKEIDSIVLSASWDEGASGVRVEFSIRDDLDDPVEWQDAGVWDTDIREKRLSFPRSAGRVWRFRFSPVTSQATTDIVTNVVANGQFTVRAELPADVNNEPPVVPPVEPPVTNIPFKSFNGPVYDIRPTDNGWVYVCGRFTEYGSVGEGWVAAPGIARIKLDGTLDTSFAVGAGFDIAQPYYAPTNMQPMKNGAILVGVCYSYLKEKGFHAVNNYGALKWQGAEVPPVIKLKWDGSRDLTFNTDAIYNPTVTGANPILSSFVGWEAKNKYYYTYNKDIDFTIGTVNIVNTNVAVLTCLNAAGDVLNEFLHTFMIAVYEHRVIIRPEIGAVIWAGIELYPGGNQGIYSFPAGVPYCQNNLVYSPANSTYGGGNFSLAVLGENLVLDEAFHNFTRTDEGGIEIAITPGGDLAFSPYLGGILIGEPITVGGIVVNSIGGGPLGEHKGLIHLQTRHSLDDSKYQEFGGSGQGAAVYEGPAFTLQRRKNGSEGFVLMWDFHGVAGDIYLQGQVDGFWVNAWNIASDTAERNYFFWDDFEGWSDVFRVVINPFGGVASSKFDYRIFNPRPVTRAAPFSLWDLRPTTGDGTNYAIYGFDSGGVGNHTDTDEEVTPLIPYPAGDVYAPAFTQLPYAGVYITGTAKKLKGSDIFVSYLPGKLFKMKTNGSIDTGFAHHTFGVDTGAPALQDKVMCAVLSADFKTLYVGGRFESVDGNAKYQNIVSIDAVTGYIS